MFMDLKTTSKASLVFILVLMQLIAPLVHGHVGVDGRASGLHFHIEDVHHSAKKVKTKSITADTTISAEAMTVSIVTGHNKTFRSPVDAALLQFVSLFSPQYCSTLEGFSKDDSFLYKAANLSPPERAPPVIFKT